MSELPDYVLALIADIAKSQGFTEYKTVCSAGSNHGDNYLGVLTAVTLSGIRNNNSNEGEDKLHLLCKLAPSNASRRQKFHSPDVFRREALMYNKILPLFAEFQREKGLTENEGFIAYPKCYVAIADEKTDQLVVIMEDLRPKGFAMFPKQQTVPADHSYRVIEQLAKFHAVSFALKQQRPEVYEDLKQCNDIMLEFFNSGSTAQTIRMSIEKDITLLDDKRQIEIMEELKENLEDIFHSCHADGACEPFGVIGHGDCHNNNILYRYEEGTKNVTDVCLVDWQIARYSSPALDLHYNLLSTTDKAVRDKEYHNFIAHYHKCLSDAITRLGSDPEKAISYEDLLKQLKRFGKFGFIWAPMMAKLMLADPSDIPDLDTFSEEIIEKEGQVEFFKEFDGDKKAAHLTRLRQLLADLIEYGYWD